MTTETLPRQERVGQASLATILRHWPRLVLYLVLLVFALFYLMPVYILVITSLKTFAEATQSQMWNLPSGIHFEGFSRVWFGAKEQGIAGLNQNFMNSVYLAVPATLLSALLGSINGYVLAKWKFRGSNVLFILLLFGMFIPYQSVLIPLVLVLSKIPWFGGGSLYGTIPGLILAHVVYGIPITTLIFRNYYATIPNELIEASRIDGATIFSIYRYILLPLSMPGFVVVMIWQFTSIWNDFLFAFTITINPEAQPVTVAVNNLAGNYIVLWNEQMAAALIGALPTLAVYIFLGRFFMRGLLAGSLKG